LAGLLYGGSSPSLLIATLVRGKRNQESLVKCQDLGMLLLLTIIGGIAAPIALVSGLEGVLITSFTGARFPAPMEIVLIL
jgi:hypothetical protein